MSRIFITLRIIFDSLLLILLEMLYFNMVDGNGRESYQGSVKPWG